MTVERRFTETVLDALDNSRVLKASGAQRQRVWRNHPLFDDLELGQRAETAVASIFLDLREFTARSFWDDADAVADLADAVLTGFTLVVEEFEGNVVGLRGDGLFAVFGHGDEPQIAALAAMAACASALAGVQDELNPALQRRGIEPVQVRAGADYGSLVFIRTGTDHTSEVNVVGFTANFASKCEKIAHSWEIVVGQGLMPFLGPNLDTTGLRPKIYTRQGERRTYSLARFHWRTYLRTLVGVPDALRSIHRDRPQIR